jgi:peptide deformylase
MLMLAIIISTMPLKKVIFADDKRLRQPAARIDQFTPELAQLGQDMLETMRALRGVGLAGPQIGEMQRIFVAEIPRPASGEVKPIHPLAGHTYILVNPEIISVGSAPVCGEEGCLSIPGWRGMVERPDWVEIAAQSVAGEPLRLKVDAFLARVFLHEMDHLDGVLYLDRITATDTLRAVEEPDSEYPGPFSLSQVLPPA